MLRSKRDWCAFAIGAGLSTAVVRVWAVDASDVLVYSIGPVRVKPHVAVSEQYDDNIFYRPSKASAFIPNPAPVEDDFVSIVSPGVTFQLGRREANHIIFDYLMDQSFYVRHGDQDHQDHSLSLDAQIQGNRLALEGQTGVQFLSGILGGGLILNTNQIARVDRKVYSDSYRVGYTISDKTSTYVVGNFAATDYKQGTALYDENDLRGTAGFSYKLTPKVSVFGEGYYGQTAISPNTPTLPDSPYSFFYGGFIGLDRALTERLNGSVRAGYETRGFGGSTPESSSPVVETALAYNFSDRTQLSLNYSRRTAVSVQVATQAYTSDSASVQLRQVLTSNGKLVGNVGVAVVNSEYESNGFYAGRRDFDLRPSASLIYNIQLWLTAQLSYEYERFDSNQYFDYADNRVTFKVSVGY